MASPWTDQLVERLKQLWAHGWSASEIGNTLGVGKNAVIGKAHRLGLKARAPAMKNVVKKGEKRPRKTPVFLTIKESMQTPRSPTPYTGPNTLQNLALDQCRYTSSTTKPFVFCAKPVSMHGPYCEEHRAICYVSKSSRAANEPLPKTWKNWR